MTTTLDFDTLPSITLGKYQFFGTNRQELLGIKKEIFHEGMYECELTPNRPRILDIGAHVGLAALYFKQTYPGCILTCVEPNPITFSIMKHNFWYNRLSDITTINKAVWHKPVELNFYQDNSDSAWYSASGIHEGAWNHEQTSEQITVDTITLDDLLTEKVDLVKIDIEGAEEEVIGNSKFLHHVDNLIVEIHPQTHNQKSPLINFLERQKFQVHVEDSHYGLRRLYAKKK